MKRIGVWLAVAAVFNALALFLYWATVHFDSGAADGGRRSSGQPVRTGAGYYGGKG